MPKAITLIDCSTTVINSYGRNGELCFPSTLCTDPSDTLFGDNYNCNRCIGQPRAFMPWIVGDVFKIQTTLADLYNTDPADPSVGFNTSFKVELHTPTSVITMTNQFASKLMLGWSGTNSYQIIEIDTSLPAFENISCWELVVKQYNSEDDLISTIRSQTFKLVEACEEADTVKINSTYNSYDCLGHYYGLPVAYVGDLMQYRNIFRYWGLVVNVGISASSTGSNTNDIESAVIFRYNTTKWYPPYQRILLKTAFDGQFTIDGKRYDKPSYNVDSGLFKITLSQRCLLLSTEIC